MTSSDLAALGRTGASLLRTVETGRLSPSYLFDGADHAVVRETALAFAAQVLAAGADDAKIEAIERQVQAGTHPDLHLLGKDKATVISVEALSGVLASAHAAPVAGTHQVFVIDPAEAMELEGVARYLKSLEEPPAGTVFLLVTTRAERLPPTVLSRVQRVRIPPIAPERIATHLVEDGCDATQARELARWAGGSLSRARRMAATTTPDVARALAEAAADDAPRGAATVDAALAVLSKEAAATDASETGKGDPKREAIRALLVDVLYVLCVEARDAAAKRETPILAGISPDGAARLLERLGVLAAAVPANVTPAVLLLETYRALRAEVRRNA